MQIQIDTKYLVNDFIKYQILTKTGCTYYNLNNDIDSVDKIASKNVSQLIIALCDKFERYYKESFQRSLCSEFCINAENLESILNNVSTELFAQNIINWSRIIALFAFCGCLAVNLNEKRMENFIEMIEKWLVNFLNKSEVLEWLKSKGNWVINFLQYYYRRIYFFRVSFKLQKKMYFLEWLKRLLPKTKYFIIDL
jgi:hypothetical protein